MDAVVAFCEEAIQWAKTNSPKFVWPVEEIEKEV